MEWGQPKAAAVVLWHGLARTGRDFDALARHLAARYRVICPDTLGRGLSQWAQDHAAEYNLPAFVRCAEELLEQLGIKRLRWVGTSMGGHVGMVAASGPLRKRITHLVLNDVGPDIQPSALRRIAEYVGNPPVFDSLRELEAWLRTVYAPFGEQTDETWRQLTETSYRRTDSGQVTVHYDPKIAAQLTSGVDAVDLWQAYDGVSCPTLLLRGAESDLLAAKTAQEMTQRGPRCRLEIIPGVGHAPMLNSPQQMALVERFLAE